VDDWNKWPALFASFVHPRYATPLLLRMQHKYNGQPEKIAKLFDAIGKMKCGAWHFLANTTIRY
jgi:hypothetical protein